MLKTIWQFLHFTSLLVFFLFSFAMVSEALGNKKAGTLKSHRGKLLTKRAEKAWEHAGRYPWHSRIMDIFYNKNNQVRRQRKRALIRIKHPSVRSRWVSYAPELGRYKDLVEPQTYKKYKKLYSLFPGEHIGKLNGQLMKMSLQRSFENRRFKVANLKGLVGEDLGDLSREARPIAAWLAEAEKLGLIESYYSVPTKSGKLMEFDSLEALIEYSKKYDVEFDHSKLDLRENVLPGWKEQLKTSL